jgi:NAD(P)-dependent dehydrogenase (short-subunit alcohol dehydrogenase family)
MKTVLDTAPLTVGLTGLKHDTLAEEVVVITGAGSNVGLATARTLAWLGAKVVIAEKNPETGSAAADLINDENKPGTALFVETDVSSEDSMKAMAEAAFRTFGKVDILVNNAMVMSLGASVINTTPEALDTQYAISARGTLLGIRAFVPGMLERHHGVVTHMSTQLRFPPSPANYCATKAAATSLMLSLAAELGEVKNTGVSVFVFVPGLVGRVPKATSENNEEPNFVGVNIGYEGRMPPEDCAAALAYCIAHAAKIHGSGLTAGQVQKHIGWPFPRPDLVPKQDFERVRDGVLVRLFGYVGQGFAKPGDPVVSISRSDAKPGESLSFHSLMGVVPGTTSK